MNKAERFLVGFFLIFMVPLTFSMVGWWLASIAYILKIAAWQQTAIFNGAMIGLGIGVIIEMLYLSNIINKFYEIESKLLVLVFLFYSFMVLMFFKGFILGNIILGAAGGVYVGRKVKFQLLNEEILNIESTKASRFFALVCALAFTFIGLSDPSVGKRFASGKLLFIAAGLIAVTATALVQFWFSKYTAYTAYNLTPKPSPTR